MAAPRAVESGSFYNALQYGLAQGEDTAAGRLARELAGRDTASRADVMRMLRAAESRQAEGGPGAQALVDPQLYTRAEVQGMSAGEVRENYDAIRESMGLWDKDGELPENMPESGTVDVPAVDSESPAGDNGENIDFYVAPNGKVLPAEYKGWIGTNRRESLINSVDDARLRKMIGEVYRPSSVIGDGGTADSIRFERKTGRLLSKSGHSQKAQNMLVYFQKLKDSGNLSDKDLKVVTELLNDLRKALEEKG